MPELHQVQVDDVLKVGSDHERVYVDIVIPLLASHVFRFRLRFSPVALPSSKH